MSQQIEVLVAGGGIGGLAAAVACAQAGWVVRLYERAPVFSEVGAGIQISPNVVRVLHHWGLETALNAVAAFPDRLQVRSALSGTVLGALPLRGRAEGRYGRLMPPSTALTCTMYCWRLSALMARSPCTRLRRCRGFMPRQPARGWRWSWKGASASKVMCWWEPMVCGVRCGVRYGVTPGHASQAIWPSVPCCRNRLCLPACAPNR